MITFDISLLESNQKILSAIHTDIARELNKVFPQATSQLKKSVKQILEKNVRAQPEWNSVVAGTLREHFGLPDGLRRLENILFVWLDSVKVEFKKMNKKDKDGFSGGIRIHAVQQSLRDVTSTRDARFITEKGSILEWLKWLLFEGGNDIILGYQIGFGRGRAGNRVMIKNEAGSWRIPPQWRGTKENNFIVRAVEQAEIEIQREIENIFNDL